MTSGPALVSILRQGSYLIASIHTALDDSQMIRFQKDLIEQIGRHRSRGVIVGIQPDVAFAMVELGMGTGSVYTALDLEEGLAYLDGRLSKKPAVGNVDRDARV